MVIASKYSLKIFRQAFWDSLPSLPSLFLAFLLVGTVWNSISLNLWYPTLMTLFVFAAPAQFIAFQIINLHHKIWPALLAVAVINLRFSLMSFSLLNYFDEKSWKRRLFDFILISNTTFALCKIKFSNNQFAPSECQQYFYTVCFFCYFAGLLGTLLGPEIFKFLPYQLQKQADLLLCLFLTCKLAQNWKKMSIMSAALFGMIATPIISFFAPGIGYVLTALIFAIAYAILGKNDE